MDLIVESPRGSSELVVAQIWPLTGRTRVEVLGQISSGIEDHRSEVMIDGGSRST